MNGFSGLGWQEGALGLAIPRTILGWSQMIVLPRHLTLSQHNQTSPSQASQTLLLIFFSRYCIFQGPGAVQEWRLNASARNASPLVGRSFLSSKMGGQANMLSTCTLPRKVSGRRGGGRRAGKRGEGSCSQGQSKRNNGDERNTLLAVVPELMLQRVACARACRHAVHGGGGASACHSRLENGGERQCMPPCSAWGGGAFVGKAEGRAVMCEDPVVGGFHSSEASASSHTLAPTCTRSTSLLSHGRTWCRSSSHSQSHLAGLAGAHVPWQQQQPAAVRARPRGGRSHSR